MLPRRPLELKPAFLLALNNLDAVCEAMGRPDDALPWYEKALEAKPGDGDVHNSLGYHCSATAS